MNTSPSPPAPAQEAMHVFWHPGVLGHDTGRGVFDTGDDPGFLAVLENHPESADRVRNMESILRRGPIAPYLHWHDGRAAAAEELLSFHTPEYIQSLVDANKTGSTTLCPGTFLNPGSWDAALFAAGTSLSAVKYILDGHAKLAYALVRPPGHHAQPNQADGYCFLNNAGLAVQQALNSGCRKVVVIDIDVHYGNGTAEGFFYSDKVLTISLHMNHGDKGYIYAMNNLVVPAVQKFEPDLIVLASGQDSSQFDPNGRQCLTMEGFWEIGQIVRRLADMHTNRRLLVVQEGGYHLTYAPYCLHATLEGVLNLPAPLLSDPIAYYPEDEDPSMKAVDVIKGFWKDTIPFLKDVFL